MRRLAAVLAVLIGGGTGLAEAALEIKPFELPTLDGKRHPAELGRLQVPEDRARPDGPKITLTFVRLPTKATAPGPPIVFLAGGPGVPGTLVGRRPAYYELFERLSELGDVILLDQRGTGLSEPTLQCVAKGSLPANTFESEAKVAIALGGVVRPCVKLVRGDGHSPEAYNTNASADDLDDLRAALGADKLRLLGVSYGTELALAAVRRHGDRIERIVLAGTRGPDHVWKLPSTLESQLERVSQLTAADSLYGALLPDLVGTVRRILDTLAWRPASLEVTDAKTGKKVRLRVGPVGLQAVLQNDICDALAVTQVPALIATLASGDSLLFARRIENLYNGLGAGISVMALATDCASGGTPERISRVAEERKRAVLGGVRNLLVNEAFCELVGSPDLGPTARAPISSDTPALFITGEYDGVSPPTQAEEVSRGFPNGIHVIIENGWNETLPAPSVQNLVVDFFKGIDVHTRRIRLVPMRFLTVEEAKERAGGRKPPPRE